MNKIFKSLKNRKGQGLVEYGLILALVVILAIAFLSPIGRKTCNAFSQVNSAMTAAGM